MPGDFEKYPPVQSEIIDVLSKICDKDGRLCEGSATTHVWSCWRFYKALSENASYSCPGKLREKDEVVAIAGNLSDGPSFIEIGLVRLFPRENSGPLFSLDEKLEKAYRG